jgi:lipoyl synthase
VSEREKKLNILPENPEVIVNKKAVGSGRFPTWLHRKLPLMGNGLKQTEQVLSENRLPTVCEEARCPNLLECWSRKTATFLAMGKSCTRSCGFCSINFAAKPQPLDLDEPERLAESARTLGLKHVVITMVARDDLSDGGAAHLAHIIAAVREINPSATVEVLTSDFQGCEASLRTVLEAKPEIFNHNIETVRALTPRVRHKATYERTLSVLRYAKQYAPHILIKSGFMVGLGETLEEIHETICDLSHVGCSIVTIGQYLQSSIRKLLVKEFVTPHQFEEYAAYGHSVGIKQMVCGPFVRSSYHAESVFEKSQR